eukprot:2462704-Prymnesium_polylepis.1
MPSDPSVCFTKKPVSYGQLQLKYKLWGCQINARRTAMDPSLPHIRVDIFGTHSDRHGCVGNLKNNDVTAEEGAPFVVMDRHHWDTVYGLEDCAGATLTNNIVGSGTSSTAHL